MTDAAIDSASTSQGSQVTWCFRNLALKKPAIVRLTYQSTPLVAPTPLPVTDPSVTIQRVSEGRGRTVALWLDRKSCADLNLEVRFSSHSSLSDD